MKFWNRRGRWRRPAGRFFLAAAFSILAAMGAGVFSGGQAMAGGGSWVEDPYGWWFDMEDGGYPEDRWMLIDDRWYYFDRDGYAVTGWRKIGGRYFYFSEDTAAMALGWLYDEDDENWYYLDLESGRHTGWLYDSGSWYWFNSRGRMANQGYTMARQRQYYFFDNGQMAANQYVGLKYYDENGLEDSRHNMVRVGDGSVTKKAREEITEALKNVPRYWIKDFIDQGWEIMYYTERPYFSAPDTEDGVYYVYHKVDEHYKKLKFTRPEALTQAFGEYIGYRLGLYGDEMGQLVPAMTVECENLKNYSAPPSYFDEKLDMQFGLAFKAFIDPENEMEFRQKSPEMYEFMEKMLYPEGRPKNFLAMPMTDDIFDGE